MMSRSFMSSTLVSVGLSLAFAIALTTAPAIRGVEAKTAMSCFVIAGKVACIDAGYVPVVPVAPAVMAPLGPNVDGENEDIVIRDDGGRQVASG